MADRLYTQSEHDQVVAASAKTYADLERQGYVVSINPDGEKNRSVGGDNYPDVIVWKPNSINSDSGTASIIEEIETSESVNDVEAEQWQNYSGIPVTFRLIVPKETVSNAAEILDQKKIRVAELWYYYSEGNQYRFLKYR